MTTDAILRALVAAGGHGWAALAFKATLAMLCALALLRALRSASASQRHLLAAATFGTLLLLPVVAALAPVRPIALRLAPGPEERAPSDERGARATAAVPALGGGSSTAVGERARSRTGASPQRILLAAYLSVAAGFLLALTFGIVRLYRLRGRAEVSVLGTRLANELARSEGTRDRIEVVTSPELAVPMTFGWTRPVILLPAETATWNEEEMMRALRHEIEHVSRGDWATQVLSRVALAVYWIHPFSWVLWRRLRLEAERACDDAVIRSQGQPETYAEQLVALARRVRGQASVPALSMATRSNLGLRVEAILAAGRRRAPRSRLASACALAAALFAVAAVGPVRLTEAATERAANVDRDVDGDRDESVDMALLRSAGNGSLSEIQQLLDAGAQPGAVLRGDGTPLIAAARGGHVDAIELLLGAGADVDRGVEGDGSPLIAAAHEGHLEAVRALLARGASIDQGVPGDGNALIMAAGSGHAHVVRFLLDQGAGIETVVPGDENALIHASEAGEADVVRLLIDRGANVNARVEALGRNNRPEWRTPLSMARRGGHAEVERILRAAGARE